ncbi:MAG: glycosyltransferase family 4 protein [Elusimicrobia bacterium]|nr:glycosyltransferase family 4 protein [Elusimicrobiota bacterium]
MSWIRRRPVLAVFLAALFLRAGLAVVTEHAPLMPEYYFTDARYADEMAAEVLAAQAEGKDFVPPVSPPKRLHAVLLASLYSAVGFQPLAAKLVMAFLGSAAVLVLYSVAACAFGARSALLAAAAVALWPSHVFMTSQNFKDGPAMLTAFLVLRAFLTALAAESRLRSTLAAAAASALLVLTGFQRPYLLAVLCASAALAAAYALALSLRRRQTVFAPALCLLAASAAPLLYRQLSTPLFAGPLQMTVYAGKPASGAAAPETGTLLQDESRAGVSTAPRLSPRWFSDLRRSQQISDQAWAQIYKGRRIGTQLFYGLELNTWRDVAVFLPKGAFYALFMPLPGLYPLEGNPGRVLASVENLAVLLLALTGFIAAARGPKTPERLLLLGFFCLMAGGSALLEFDLGSAARHKLVYLPMLFPFASSLVSERLPPRQGRRRAFEVLECGGPGGTGNQVAAICNGLDPSRFEVCLVYAVRDGRPQDYRDKAKAAQAAFFIPEMVREISPWRDLKAFLCLRRLFMLEAPDIVHTHSSKAGVLGRLAAWTTGVPLVFHSPRGYGFLQSDRPGSSRFLYWLLEWSVSWIGEIVAVSPSEARLGRSLSWGGPVHVVPDPYLGQASPSRGPRGDGILVAACGRLTYARHPEAYLRLAQGLARSRPDIRCVWVGGGEWEAEMRSSIKDLGLDGKVELTGWIEPPQALERLAAADVFVHYSRWEGLPNAVLEAMALGLPVVASDVPGNRDAVVHGETGFIVRDEPALLEHALKLAQDPALRRRLGQAGRERVLKQYCPSAAFAALARLYSGAPQA